MTQEQSNKLQELKKLLDAGVLTQEEYDREKESLMQGQFDIDSEKGNDTAKLKKAIIIGLVFLLAVVLVYALPILFRAIKYSNDNSIGDSQDIENVVVPPGQDSIRVNYVMGEQSSDNEFSLADSNPYTDSISYNDFCLDEKGNPVCYRIGEFDDLNFNPPAMADFETHTNGKIAYYIWPSKDKKRTTMIAISPGGVFKPQGIRSSHVIASDYAYNPDSVCQRFYGPYIYHKAAKWITWDTPASDKKYTEIQPLCQLMNVWLTPKAQKEADRLFQLLAYSDSIEVRDGVYYKSQNIPMSEEEIVLAKRYGIIKE